MPVAAAQQEDIRSPESASTTPQITPPTLQSIFFSMPDPYLPSQSIAIFSSLASYYEAAAGSWIIASIPYASRTGPEAQQHLLNHSQSCVRTPIPA
jgi:hypothetical protein